MALNIDVLYPGPEFPGDRAVFLGRSKLITGKNSGITTHPGFAVVEMMLGERESTTITYSGGPIGIDGEEEIEWQGLSKTGVCVNPEDNDDFSFGFGNSDNGFSIAISDLLDPRIYENPRITAYHITRGNDTLLNLREIDGQYLIEEGDLYHSAIDFFVSLSNGVNGNFNNVFKPVNDIRNSHSRLEKQVKGALLKDSIPQTK